MSRRPRTAEVAVRGGTWCAVVCALIGAGRLATAGEATAPSVEGTIAERFSEADVNEMPDFRRHVIPLAGRLGCNGRACHGSFQGQGGFRLSLFGYELKSDHDALTAGDEPRVNLAAPAESLILQKPTLTIDHEGGERFAADSWSYRVLRKWIEGGAAWDESKDAQFVRLDVTPSEIHFYGSDEAAQLKVVVHWSDGTSEDVTPLARFRTNDETVAVIDESGKVTSVGAGDTHVVAFYDNGVVPVEVTRPVSDRVGANYPDVVARTKVDELVLAKLKKLGVVPSPVCTDQEFLRRVSLDLTGTLPTVEEIEAFLADASPDKRSRKIDELMTRPAYAAWWATKLCDVMGNSEQNNADQQFRSEQARQWYSWVYRRLADNVPYDQLIEGIVMANGRLPGQSYDEYAAEMTSYVRETDPADFADRQTMPHFWSRRNIRQPEEKALSFSYAFLGVRLECAQCHKHPFDQWTQQDFQQFMAFFQGINYGTAPDARDRMKEMQEELGLGEKRGNEVRNALRQLAKEGKAIPWQELYVRTNAPPRERNRDKNDRVQAGRVITPKLLGGDELVAQKFGDPRQALMDWMRNSENPYFARAFVNRVWANDFGRGIIEPPDDQNLANPPSNAPLLDYLAAAFAEHGFDIRWLHREIMNTDTYQRSWQPNDTNKFDQRNFSRAVPRRLPAEVAYDAIAMATAGAAEQKERTDNPLTRAIGYGSAATRGNNLAYVLTTFGKPLRTTNCDCERSNEASLLQTVFLRNDRETLTLIDRPTGWLAEVTRVPDPPSDPENEDPAGLIRVVERRIARMKKEGKDAEVARLEKRLAELQKVAADPNRAPPASPGSESAAAAEELVRQAWLRTVSREPTAEERDRALAYVSEAPDSRSGLRDVLWALINTKEFIANH